MSVKLSLEALGVKTALVPKSTDFRAFESFAPCESSLRSRNERAVARWNDLTTVASEEELIHACSMRSVDFDGMLSIASLLAGEKALKTTKIELQEDESGSRFVAKSGLTKGELVVAESPFLFVTNVQASSLESLHQDNGRSDSIALLLRIINEATGDCSELQARLALLFPRTEEQLAGLTITQFDPSPVTAFLQAQLPQAAKNLYTTPEMLVAKIKLNALSFDPRTETRSGYAFQDTLGGAALYSVGSLFDHSCRPNLYRYSCGNQLVVRALVDIPAGESLGFSYLTEKFLAAPLASRQAMLGERNFVCRCARCESKSGHANECVESEEMEESREEWLDELLDASRPVGDLVQAIYERIRPCNNLHVRSELLKAVMDLTWEQGQWHDFLLALEQAQANDRNRLGLWMPTDDHRGEVSDETAICLRYQMLVAHLAQYYQNQHALPSDAIYNYAALFTSLIKMHSMWYGGGTSFFSARYADDWIAFQGGSLPWVDEFKELAREWLRGEVAKIGHSNGDFFG
ncbi:MAG: uncharacterized protein KVP18_000090 [Porospora cf. gigantea A]|uniref:uncharacterized protein n=1 Tax=Porospora cf. gigantea A TaxID=2853593 RepID=UPI00355952CF|nr:MAG: hypothetical protein KVP18_000090 [Porospora cf. gigantea A]